MDFGVVRIVRKTELFSWIVGHDFNLLKSNNSVGFGKTVFKGLEWIYIKMYFCKSTCIENENKINRLCNCDAFGIAFMESK